MNVNAPAELRTVISGLASTAALVSSRLWAERETPPPGYKPGDGPAIAFKTRDIQGDEEDAVVTLSFQFKFYAANEAAAYGLFRLFRDEALYLKSGKVITISQEGGGSTLLEPETNWIYNLAYFQVMFLNT